ncbi:MAG: 16S rRNA (guanine(527)-N(7))-methyltransferase RsmG [Desulfonatronovibrio sp.]
MKQHEIQKDLEKRGFFLTSDALAGLHTYIELLLKWNKVMNLVGPSKGKEIFQDLILDSFYLNRFLGEVFKGDDNTVTLDLGAGAGLPGIPLRLIWKCGKYYLVESRMKRAVFMNQAVAAIEIDNTFVLNCRFQDIDKRLLPVQQVVSRAFMPWHQLLPIAGQILVEKGVLTVLSSEKYSGQNLPGFEIIDVMEYAVNSKKRYFWALASNI